MNILFIIGVIIFAIVLFVLLKITKKIVKFLFSVIFIVLLISLVFGFFVFKDFRDFQNNFFDSKNTFLVQSNGTIIQGFSATGFAQDRELLNQDQIESLQQNYQNKDYKSMIDDVYKLFVIDTEVLAGDIEEFDVDVIFDQVDNVEVYPESPMFLAIRYVPWLVNFKSGIVNSPEEQ